MAYAAPAPKAADFGLVSGYAPPPANAADFALATAAGAALGASLTASASLSAQLSGALPATTAAGAGSFTGRLAPWAAGLTAGAGLYARLQSDLGLLATLQASGQLTARLPPWGAQLASTSTSQAALSDALPGVALTAAGRFAGTLAAAAEPYRIPAATAVDFALASGYTAPAPGTTDYAWGALPPAEPVLFDAALTAAGALAAELGPAWDVIWRGGMRGDGVQRGAVPRSNVGTGLRYSRGAPQRTRAVAGNARMGEPTGAATDAAWTAGERREQIKGTGTPWRLPGRQERGTDAAWAAPRLRPAAATAPTWGNPPRKRQVAALPWGRLRVVQILTAAEWLYPPAKDRRYRGPWWSVRRHGTTYPPPYVYHPPERGEPVAFALAGGYQVPAVEAVAFSLRDPPPARPIQPRDWNEQLPHHDPPRREPRKALPWGPDGAPKWPTTEPSTPYDQERPDQPAPLEPPIKGSYPTMPTIECERLDTGQPILVNAARVTTDLDSWCWQVSLQLARREDLEAVRPGSAGPVAVVLRINGYAWHLLIEGYNSGRVHAGSTYRASGRSLSAELAAPYAPARAHVEDQALMAQQLALSELSYTGWALDWQAPDWYVPGGVWAYQGTTPLQAIRKIAEACGAVVQSAADAKSLVVQPRYPVSPWEWAGATPDAILPAAHIVQLAENWQPGPPYNAIYTAGQQQGVLVGVVRRGTAGDRVAPQVVHPLICTKGAGTERGRNELAAAGNKGRVTATAALLPATAPGLLLPGQLLEVREDSTWRGQVMSVTVEATRQNATTVRQSVEVERHYG